MQRLTWYLFFKIVEIVMSLPETYLGKCVNTKATTNSFCIRKIKCLYIFNVTFIFLLNIFHHYFSMSFSDFSFTGNKLNLFLPGIVTYQRRIQNLVEHLRQRFLRKQITANCFLIKQKQLQKQFLDEVLVKSCASNMLQVYRRTMQCNAALLKLYFRKGVLI